MRVVLSVEGDPGDGSRLGCGRSEASQRQLEPSRHAKASMTEQSMEAEEDAYIERQRDHDETANQALHGECPVGAQRRDMKRHQCECVAPVDRRAVGALAPTTPITAR